MRLPAMDVCKTLFYSGIDAVQPNKLVQQALSLTGTTLTVTKPSVKPNTQQPSYQLHTNVYIAAFGKASLGMTSGAFELLRDHVLKGIVSAPMDSAQLSFPPSITVREGAHGNLPDDASLRSAKEVAEMAQSLNEQDLLLVLVSGGGSALLPLPLSGLSLEKKQEVIRNLANSGADIQELNTVRQQLSAIKAGGLARMAAPAKVLSLIFSDIIGNPPHLIASGPTVAPLTTRDEAGSILRKYKIDDTVLAALPPPVGKACYSHVSNHIIGSNADCLNAMRSQAESIGYRSIIVTDSMQCDAGRAAERIAAVLVDLVSGKEPSDGENGSWMKIIISSGLQSEKTGKAGNEAKRICLIFGGETTVEVTSGKGGRNQHLALVLLRSLKDHLPFFEQLGLKLAILAAGTDGQDGPTDAAGACFDLDAMRGVTALDGSEKRGWDLVEDFILRTDSYSFWNFFGGGCYHLKTGPTGTNVMDVVVVLIDF